MFLSQDLFLNDSGRLFKYHGAEFQFIFLIGCEGKLLDALNAVAAKHSGYRHAETFPSLFSIDDCRTGNQRTGIFDNCAHHDFKANGTAPTRGPSSLQFLVSF